LKKALLHCVLNRIDEVVGKLRVRLFNSPEGLTIIVTVPAPDNVELEPLDCGKRVIPWSDLPPRA
jgi:hypothetical protein